MLVQLTSRSGPDHDTAGKAVLAYLHPGRPPNAQANAEGRRQDDRQEEQKQEAAPQGSVHFFQNTV